MRILGLETSCDETAAAVVDDGSMVVSNVVATQHELHRKYAGVVPEIASRAHLDRLSPVVSEALERAGATPADLDAIAIGNRPGLVGSLIVGLSAAKSLAWSLGKPLVGVDHVHAHLYAPHLHAPGADPPPIAYPALGLVVSGGHTSIYRLGSPIEAIAIGRTIDDAVGEAYDKAAVMLGLGYPGGPNLDRLAQNGDPDRYELPRSLLGKDSLDFSFSGLKTALLYLVRGRPTGRGKTATFERSADDLTDADRADLAASFQAAAIGAVIAKVERALDQQPTSTLIVGGGVSANSRLRTELAQLGDRRGVAIHAPPMDYCLDNAAMIAGHAAPLLAAGRVSDLSLPAVATTALR